MALLTSFTTFTFPQKVGIAITGPVGPHFPGEGFGFPRERHSLKELSRAVPVPLPSMSAPRPLRVHCLALLAMGLLLLVTAAPALARMTCVQNGHSVLNVGAAADCCPVDDRPDGPTLAATCCQVLQAQPQHVDFVKVCGASVPAPVVLMLPEALVQLPALPADVRRDIRYARPPPLAPSERLALISIFRI